jgi:hypothetical protein
MAGISSQRLEMHIEAIAAITATPGHGATRLTYTPEFAKAVDYLANYATGNGFSLAQDRWGRVSCATGRGAYRCATVLLWLPGTDPGTRKSSASYPAA